MFPLFESIKIQDGKWHNLHLHEDRMERSIRAYYSEKKRFNLLEEIPVPAKYFKGLYKCRVDYNVEKCKVHFSSYVNKEIKTLQLLKVGSSLNYKLKWSDRSHLNKLYLKKKNCDDVLLIRDGLVLDSSYANIVFKNRYGWYTPKEALLKGTMRQFLLNKGYIQAKHISITDIKNYESFTLINAMNEIGDMGIHPIFNIVGI